MTEGKLTGDSIPAATSEYGRRAMPSWAAIPLRIVSSARLRSSKIQTRLTSLFSTATSDYINNHLDLYQNPNYTVFGDSPYTKPKNSLSDTC
jgi:hypothetical protein